MRFFKSPLGLTMVFFLVVTALQWTRFAEAAAMIGLLAALAIVTFFLHELGHALFGIAAGYRFQFLTAGPLTIARDGLHINETWAYYGGIASCTPTTDHLQHIRRQHIWFAAGGPIVSILCVIVALTIGALVDSDVLMYFGLLNIGIVAATAIPFSGTFKSDGRVVLDLLRNDAQTDAYLSSILLTKEMMTTAHPTTWSAHLIEQARHTKAAEETVMNGFILFYYDVLTEGFEQASASLTPYKALPITNKNKLMLQGITHVKQLDLVWTGEATVEALQAFQKQMVAMEPVSYTRSEWLIAHFAGDAQLAARKKAEHLKLLAQGKKQFGFYYAEERVTTLLLEKL